MHRYDYGRLSPTLEALLTEGSKEFNAIPASDSTSLKLSMSEFVVSHEIGNDCIEPSHCENSELCNINNHDMSGKGVSTAQYKMVEATGDSKTTCIDQIMCDCLSKTKDGPVAEDFVDHQIHTPNQLNKVHSPINLMLPKLLSQYFGYFVFNNLIW